MAVDSNAYHQLKTAFDSRGVTLVAVSKTKPIEDILELYHLGQRDFGENYVQELVEKEKQLPKDIRWHFIGHLQTNKVKLIVPIVQLIHGVDSLKLLKEIDKQAGKLNKTINCLLQVHIAQEETKFGFNETELNEVANEFDSLENVNICGLMGMASFTDDTEQIKKEFSSLNKIFKRFKKFSVLSMGMSGDYKTAIEEGSAMVRIGSLLFGNR